MSAPLTKEERLSKIADADYDEHMAYDQDAYDRDGVSETDTQQNTDRRLDASDGLGRLELFTYNEQGYRNAPPVPTVPHGPPEPRGFERFATDSMEDIPRSVYQLPAEPYASAPAAPSPTDIRSAVRWLGQWAQPFDGTAIITRRYANALDKAGLPVFLPSAGGWFVNDLNDAVYLEVRTMLGRTPRSMPITVHHLVPTEQGLVAALYPGSSFEFDQEGAERNHERTVLLSVWEQIPSDRWDRAPMAVLLRKFAAHIVPCEDNAALLRLAGVPSEKIHVIAHPFDTAETAALQAPRPKRDPAEKIRFYSIGKWEPRKDPFKVLKAFLRAVKEADGAQLETSTLTFYTSDWWQRDSYPRVHEAIRRACLEVDFSETVAARYVTMVTEPQPSMVPVHRAHDVFVTASHGEAWGMPAFDAVLAGNKLLAPRWGGFKAFLPPETEGLPFTMAPVMPYYAHRFGTKKALWADVDERALTARMVAIMRGEETFEGVPYSEENFRQQNPLAVGRQMRQALEAIVGPAYPWRDGQ